MRADHEQGPLRRFHAEETDFWSNVYYWTTPVENCVDGRTDVKCVPYDEWVAHVVGAAQHVTTVRTRGSRRPCLGRGGCRAVRLLHRAPRLRLAGLLAPALVWLGLLYLVPLGFLLATAFFDTDSFTGRITYAFTTENVVDVLTTPAYLLTVPARSGWRSG